jgi:hypothetical protein
MLPSGNGHMLGGWDSDNCDHRGQRKQGACVVCGLWLLRVAVDGYGCCAGGTWEESKEQLARSGHVGGAGARGVE